MDNQACYDVQTQHESFEWMLMQVRHIRLLKANGYLAFVDTIICWRNLSLCPNFRYLFFVQIYVLHP